MKVNSEKSIYKSMPVYILNLLIFPIKMMIPQPIVKIIPFLSTNEDIRIGIVKNNIKGKLLDIGCGANRLSMEYRAQGKEGVGVDVYNWDNVDLIVEDTSSIPFEDACFDTITFVACLNHIPNRAEVLTEACRLLAPHGRILITNLTPFISKIWHAYAYWDDDQHERGMSEGEVFGFTSQELINLLKENGLTIVARKKFSWALNELFICEKP